MLTLFASYALQKDMPWEDIQRGRSVEESENKSIYTATARRERTCYPPPP